MDNRPIYKTAKQLGIKERTRQGLITLMGELALGQIPHEPDIDVLKLGTPISFNMNRDCGTVCCIGGWLVSRDQVVSVYGYNDHPVLGPLFYPTDLDGEVDWEDITPLQASQAILNVLTLGVPRWRDVVLGDAA